ncbi:MULTISPECIES: hypothetical protein [unclassified Parabacteroides]|uniref:hypothetical protein n=1 Tax=unclassified Parabacteroides TaxID=2649774 RepID=UPI002474DF93|nr:MULTISPECIES: hypothetical protein [unclassified Parabacteroides]
MDNRLKYIRQFCDTHYPATDGEDFWPSNLPEAYLINRDKILADMPFSEEKYYSFDTLQEVIEDLELDDEALLDFIIFLYYHTFESSQNKFITYGSKVEEINKFITDNIDNPNLKITISTKGRGNSYTITKPNLIKGLFAVYRTNEPYVNYSIIRDDNPDTLRKLSYVIIKNLIDNLPITKTPNIRYSNKERLLCLCVLYLCDFLLGNPKIVCHNDNNIVFDKLMNDFEGTEIFLNTLA